MGSKKVVVDNTSSDEIAGLYPAVVEERMEHVVTPNKKACSSGLGLWEDIKAALGPNPYVDLRLGYEATVGAGLPIISTLRDLVETGDEVSRILDQPSAEHLSCP
jgi:homoserine dehydrogenase